MKHIPVSKKVMGAFVAVIGIGVPLFGAWVDSGVLLLFLVNVLAGSAMLLAGAALDSPRSSTHDASSRPRPRIEPVPGGLARLIVRWLPFSRRGKAEVFDQLIADMWVEHIEAVATEKWWLPHVVELRGYAAFLVTLVFYLGSASAKRVFEIWKMVP